MSKKKIKDKGELKRLLDIFSGENERVKDVMKKSYGDISEWDVSEVTDMSELFFDKEFNGDISNWDVKNVTDMHGMFWKSNFDGDISKWNVGKVTNMNYMFAESQFNQDISEWDTSSVKSMEDMFVSSKFNKDISKWNVKNVEKMTTMFTGSIFNGDISEWDTSSVKDMSGMFSVSKFNGDISNWNLKNVTDMSFMFEGSEYVKNNLLKFVFCRKSSSETDVNYIFYDDNKEINNILFDISFNSRDNNYLNSMKKIRKPRESIGICKDIFYILDEDEYESDKHISNDSKHIILISPDDEILCYSMEYISEIFNDYKKWLVECTGNIIEETNDKTMRSFDDEYYMGLPISSDGRIAYIPVSEVKRLAFEFLRGTKIFQIEAKNEDGEHKHITHTSSFINVHYDNSDDRDFVSMNHCQAGSNILVYTIKKIE